MKIVGGVLFIALVIIIGTLGYHAMFVKSNAQGVRQAFPLPVYTDTTVKPNTSLNKTAGSSGVPNTTTTDTDDLMGELNQTSDDAGASDFQLLQQQSSQL